MKLTKFDTLESLIEFLKANPLWISGFVDGEGCFTGSFTIDKRSTWGIQPQAEFNIVQNNVDQLLLEAIKEIFDNKGGVYSRPNNMSVYSVRKTKDLREVVIPYFLRHPLISNKARELETFAIYLALLSSNEHVGDSLKARDQLLKLALVLKELNAKRLVGHKSDRLDLIIDWLKALNDVPTMEAKLELKEQANLLKKRNKDLSEIPE
jgi:hypothetical protein|uniref:LAGLIDADG homing endonuclease n=1 Tax=uncultured Glomus TaxID=231055 RepID=D4HU03_9GLOM|nr:LAGLIDADG homing endonuclease [uncultured Glomus]